MGSTELQRQFAHIVVGEEDRPGVMFTPKGGVQLDADWYNIVPMDSSVAIITDSGTELCRTDSADHATILQEALNMRAEHYALRAYGRLHGKLPTQQALAATENLLRLKEKELADTKALVRRIKNEASKLLSTATAMLNRSEKACEGLKQELVSAQCKHARRYSRGFFAWDKQVSARWSK